MSVLNLYRQSVSPFPGGGRRVWEGEIDARSPAVLFLGHLAAIWEADHGLELDCQTFFSFFFLVRKKKSFINPILLEAQDGAWEENMNLKIVTGKSDGGR